MNEHPSPNDKNETLTERVLGRIDSEHLSPRPRWAFALENWFFWTLGALALALGALASAAALFEVANTGWDFYMDTHRDLLTFIVAAAPYLWLLVLALFVFIGYENIRRTKRGYRYPLAVIVIGSILTSVVLGTALFAAGFGEEIEEAIGDHPPFYRPVVLAEHAHWLSPQQGLLGGTIVAVSTTSESFTLKDFDGAVWTIDASDLGATSTAAVERGGVVRVIGLPTTNATSTTLHACAVFSWKTYGAPTDDALPPFAPLPMPMPERSMGGMRISLCRGASPYTSPRATGGE